MSLNPKITCHAEGDRCHGCNHYKDPVTYPVCEYASNKLTARAEIRKLEVQLDHYWQSHDMAEEAFKERDDARAEAARMRELLNESEVEANALSHEVARLRAAIQRALDDEESGTGWGPDVTACAYLREALAAKGKNDL